MRMRQAILHIGTGKTGSTSLQRMLASKRDVMLADGFAYPHAPGRANHFKLAIAAAEPRTANRMIGLLGQGATLNSVREGFRKELGEELAALPDSVHTVVFSNEHTGAKVTSPAAARRLRTFLEPWFSAFRIVVYLRRQDEFVVSRYTTRLRAGGTEAAVLPSIDEMIGDEGDDEEMQPPVGEAAMNDESETQPISSALDYARKLDHWTAVFGKEALRPRIFDRRAFEGGDLMLDFLRTCGMPDAYAVGARSHNASLLPEAQELLRRLNKLRVKLASEGINLPKTPNYVKKALDLHFAGAGRRPSRAQAEAFVAQFADSNERVRAAFFPDQPLLFSNDFSRYPETPDPLPPEGSILDVALRLIANADPTAKQGAPEADEHYRRGQAFLDRGRTAKAEEELRKALELLPTHIQAKRALVQISRQRKMERQRRDDLTISLPKEASEATLIARAVATEGGAADAQALAKENTARELRKEMRREKRRLARRAGA